MNATHSKALAAASVLLALPVLSSCAVSFGAQTDQVYTPADGENDRQGTVDVLNALIVSETDGAGTLIAGLSNGDTEEPDTLTGVSGIGEDADLTFSLEGGETTIPAGGFIQMADGETGHVVVTGDPEKLRAGYFVRVSFTFANAEPAELNVPVLPPGDVYDDVVLPGSSETPAG